MKKQILVGISILIFLTICFLFILLIKNSAENQTRIITKNIKLEDIQLQEEKKETKTNEQEKIEEINLPEYENMKKQIGGYKVIGKLTIPRLELEKYILEKTDEKSLKLGITKICGPGINKEGNFCIVGHNYTNSFGKLKKLEIGDIFILTDTYQREVQYMIYEIQKVSPENTECLNQDTKGEREATLITCTLRCFKKTCYKRNRSL